MLPLAIQHPPHCEMDHPLSVVFARKAIKLLHRGDVLVQSRWLELWILLANVIPAEACFPRDPPGEQSSAQRAVGQCRNAIAAAVRQDVSLGVALEQIVAAAEPYAAGRRHRKPPSARR